MKTKEMIQDTRGSQRSLGERQLLRYEALCGLGRFGGRTLLEMDCGAGDFYAYLQAKRQRPSYTGVEASAEAVSRGQARFAGEPGCRFELGGALDYQPASPYEFVVAGELSRVFLEGGAASLARVIGRLFSWCTVGAALSFQSARAPSRASHGIYVDPAAAVKAAFRLTHAVRLAHDYLPDDFTLYLYRTPIRQAPPAQGVSL